MSPPASVREILADLVRVNTVNPAYGDGGTEGNLLPYLRAFGARHGLETFEQEVFPGRANLVFRLPGRSPRRLVLEAHTDTVSIKGMTIPPFEPQIRGGRLHGRGAVDDKAGLAAMLHAVAALRAAGIAPPAEVWLAAVVDEEFSFRGVVRLCEGLRADAAVVAEPTDLRVVVASKGVLRVRFEARGRAAHSAKPHLGRNAITDLSRLILALEEEHAHLAGIPHPLLGPATVSVGTVRGGVQINLVPDRAEAEVDRRLLPGESAAEVLAGWERLLAGLRDRHPGSDLRLALPPLLVDEALDTPADAPLALAARRVLRDLGRDDAPAGVPFGSDASKFSRAGIPAILLGPGSIDQAHAADEWVELAEVEQAAECYRRLLLAFE